MREQEIVPDASFGHILHAIVPWVVLVAIIAAVLSSVSNFQRAEKPTWGSGSSSGTSDAAAVATAAPQPVVGLEAVATTALQLRAEPDDVSVVLGKVKKGAVLDILMKQAAHFKVQDDAGHIGWIPNDTEFIDVRQKTTK